MVKIIKRGTPPDTKPRKATCRDCGTKIEFAVKEAKYVSDQRDGDILQIKCPVCKATITVNA